MILQVISLNIHPLPPWCIDRTYVKEETFKKLKKIP